MARKNRITKSYSLFREATGVICAFIVVMAYVAIGFVQLAIQVTTGSAPSMAGDWNAAMLSLASAALGFLIGKQTTLPTQTHEEDEIELPVLSVKGFGNEGLPGKDIHLGK